MQALSNSAKSPGIARFRTNGIRYQKGSIGLNDRKDKALLTLVADSLRKIVTFPPILIVLYLLRSQFFRRGRRVACESKA
jgi:hypothetical protein